MNLWKTVIVHFQTHNFLLEFQFKKYNTSINRSGFLKQLIASIAIGKLPVSLTKDFRKIYLLQCFVAGFCHYEGMKLLDSMKEGDLLELVRESENVYDDCAIAHHLQGNKIGFIPASVIEMLSYLLDADALILLL